MPSRTQRVALKQRAQASLVILAALLSLCLPSFCFGQTVTSANPSAIFTGECTRVIVTGTGFVSGTQVLFNNTPVYTVYNSATQVTAYINAEPKLGGALTISAMNPGQTLNSLHNTPNPSISVTLDTTNTSTWANACTAEPTFTMPAGFMGLSDETNDGWNIGSTSLGYGINTAYRKLLSYLMDSPSSPFLIRVGGASTDGLTSASVAPYNEIHALYPGVRFTLGVPLYNSSETTAQTLGYAETIATTYGSTATSGTLDSVEIGNETDTYQSQAGNNRAYSFDVYMPNYETWVDDIHAQTASTNLQFTGASWASQRTLINEWYWNPNYTDESPGYLETFLTNSNGLTGVTKSIAAHYYSGGGGHYQGTSPYAPSYLLGYPVAAGGPGPLQFSEKSNSTNFYFVPGVLGWAAKMVHSNGHNQTFRVNESNSVDGGGQDTVSNSFAAALWAVDYMFELANAGVDGVNFHSPIGGGVRQLTGTCATSGQTLNAPCIPVPAYSPWTFNVANGPNNNHYPASYTLESVNPLFYGLYFFHLAVPDGAKFVPMSVTSPHNVKVWATKDSSGTLRVVVINKDTTWSGNVPVAISGYNTTGQLLLMKCANGYAGTLQFANNTTLTGTTGITVGGQTWDGSTDGTIQGTQTTTSVTLSGSYYYVNLQPGQAAILTLTPAS